MKKPTAGGGWPSVWYAFAKARRAGGLWRLYKALRRPNTCKTCAVGMGGQRGGMVNEAGRYPEVCKKSIQAMVADLGGAVHRNFFDDFSLEKLRGFSSRELEAAGRLVQPLCAGPLDSHYRPISWEDALERIAAKLQKTDPDERLLLPERTLVQRGGISPPVGRAALRNQSRQQLLLLLPPGLRRGLELDHRLGHGHGAARRHRALRPDLPARRQPGLQPSPAHALADRPAAAEAGRSSS